VKVYYYGCWNGKGHFLWQPNGRWVEGDESLATPWPSGYRLCPGWVDQYNLGPQVQGEAGLHHKDGWTALAFWDRSVDDRFGCISVFYAEGTYDSAAMLEVAREHFSKVWARYPFEVRIVSRPTDVLNTKQVCPQCGRSAFGAVLDGWAHDPPGWFSKGGVRACSVACVTKASSQSTAS
jgi:hypothetical protein